MQIPNINTFNEAKNVNRDSPVAALVAVAVAVAVVVA